MKRIFSISLVLTVALSMLSGCEDRLDSNIGEAEKVAMSYM